MDEFLGKNKKVKVSKLKGHEVFQKIEKEGNCKCFSKSALSGIKEVVLFEEISVGNNEELFKSLQKWTTADA